MTWESVLHGLAVISALGGAAALFLLGRYPTLLGNHSRLTARVVALESSLSEVRAQSATLEQVRHTLELVQRDGKNNNELLHTIIRGHMADKS
ncbi:hypothetical protein [Acetobacter cibinongensis]|uniref:Uncharacterized protein n=1 Tax=Acetobacter cibinongensis TaxID=146475 RepID=A0A1Z5YTB0_9PROT|nr:hypothetical protein [Acetobacter cibinongensis]OUJ01538.1 hypothetical protein HK14_08870 [Acetobacter cibinongensis]